MRNYKKEIFIHRNKREHIKSIMSSSSRNFDNLDYILKRVEVHKLTKHIMQLKNEWKEKKDICK